MQDDDAKNLLVVVCLSSSSMMMMVLPADDASLAAVLCAWLSVCLRVAHVGGCFFAFGGCTGKERFGVARNSHERHVIITWFTYWQWRAGLASEALEDPFYTNWGSIIQ